MGREARRVPLGWEHPKENDGYYKPLHDGCKLNAAMESWDKGLILWLNGERAGYQDGERVTVAIDEDLAQTREGFEEWDGQRPNPDDYMPVFTEEEAVGWQMYETCSEGTPISPVMKSPEDLADWLFENKADAFADMTATRAGWLSTITSKHGSISAVLVPGRGIISGVEAMKS